jgi:ubiquinone/menaquinone biosynthesis C-methylase UbiE
MMKPVDETKLNAFLGQVISDLSASYGGVMVSLGRRLGLYRAMAGAGPVSSVELASRSGCAERYVREWLNSQAAGGYVAFHPSSQTYELTPEQALVLADPDSPVFVAPAWEVPGSMWIDQEKTIRAFRTGEGVPWGEHDARLYEGVAAFYRSAYSGSLVQKWLPALDGIEERLRAGAKVADVGCGYGHSTVLMAQAFPKSVFHGFDTHRGSIEAARETARDGEVEDRVTFEALDAASVPDEQFDLVCFFDCLHDMGDPVAALSRVRRTLRPGGSVMIVEPAAADAVEGNINPVSRLFYAASTALCCPHSVSENGIALGGQAGMKRLAEVCGKAGLSRVEKVYEDPFNMVLQARV